MLADRARSLWIEAESEDEPDQEGFAWFRDVDRRLWKLAESIADVRFFGARGDESQDDSAAINAAIRHCRTTGKALYFPGGHTFLVRNSLDFTEMQPFETLPLMVYGDGRLSSLILADLSEAYPVLDLTNSKRTTFRHISVRTKRSSQDTCTLLLAENRGAGANLIRFEGCAFYNSSPKAGASVVNVSGDQIYFVDSEISANGESATCALRADGRNALSIASKMYGVVEGHIGDLTMFAAQRCNITCAGGYTIDIESFALVSMNECYFATLPSPKVVSSIIRLEGGRRTMRPSFLNCRSEHHSDHGLRSVFNIVDNITDGQFTGNFTSTKQTALFSGTGSIVRCSTSGSVTGTLFDRIGPVIGSEFSIHDGVNDLGEVDPVLMAGSKNVRLQGRVGSVASIKRKLSFCPGLMVNGTSGEDQAVGLPSVSFGPKRVAFSHPNTPTNWRVRASGPSGRLICESVQADAGRGHGVLCRLSVSLAPLSYVAGGADEHVLPAMQISFVGKFIPPHELTKDVSWRLSMGSRFTQEITRNMLRNSGDGIAVNSTIHLFRAEGGMIEGYVLTEIASDDMKSAFKILTVIDPFSLDARGVCAEEIVILLGPVIKTESASMYFWTEA